MATVLLGLAGWGWWTFFGPADQATANETDAAVTTAVRPADTKPPALSADRKTKVEAAKNYVDLKNYALAEDLYKQVLTTDPTSVEALQALASVLYREDKIEEAAAVLDRIPK
jgi:thioredoxin-like negative regulator of GroEL